MWWNTVKSIKLATFFTTQQGLNSLMCRQRISWCATDNNVVMVKKLLDVTDAGRNTFHDIQYVQYTSSKSKRKRKKKLRYSVVYCSLCLHIITCQISKLKDEDVEMVLRRGIKNKKWNVNLLVLGLFFGARHLGTPGPLGQSSCYESYRYTRYTVLIAIH